MLIDLILKIELARALVEHGLGNVGSEGFSDWVAEFTAFVDHHLDDEA